MYGGAIAVLAWFLIWPKLKQDKIAVEVRGVNVYSNTQIIPN
jgi:hypothetical protein